MEDESTETTLAAGIILFTENMSNKTEFEPIFLLLRCSKNGHWSPPKGISEFNETNNFLITAYRETMEETGIAPEQIYIYDDFLKETNYKAWNKNKKVTYYLGECKRKPEITISDEHSEYIWANIKEVRQLIEFDSLIQIFDDAFEKIMQGKKK